MKTKKNLGVHLGFFSFFVLPASVARSVMQTVTLFMSKTDKPCNLTGELAGGLPQQPRAESRTHEVIVGTNRNMFIMVYEIIPT